MTVIAGVMDTEMTPPYMHISLEEFFSSGFPQTRMVGTPGAQGSTIAGAQGAGEKTPSFAAVAAMTAGLLGQLHMPKVGNLLSMIVATFKFMAFTVCWDDTESGKGAAPKNAFTDGRHDRGIAHSSYLQLPIDVLRAGAGIRFQDLPGAKAHQRPRLPQQH